MSDLHFHNWSQFHTIGPDMVNSRLRIILDAVGEAVEHLKDLGGTNIYVAGDVFHTRGSVATSVLNPVIECFKKHIDDGITFRIIPGNHDLGTKDTQWIGNAIQSLSGVGCEIVEKITEFEDDKVIMFPWDDDLESLYKDLRVNYDSEYSAIIHAPLNDVIRGIPNTGLNPLDLEGLGYKNVFSGHYHNHKNFADKVFSIGSLTHQTWSDVDTRSGYMVILPNGNYTQVETTAPQFVDTDRVDFTQLKGNYVRHATNSTDAAKIEDFRKMFKDKGALGVQIKSEPSFEVTRTTKSKGANPTLAESMSGWAEENFANENIRAKVLKEANEILGAIS